MSLLSGRGLRTLVEEQVGRWKGQQARREAHGPWPLVTVSREFGSQGAAVGRLVAERAGFSFWDHELVHAVSEQTGLQEALLDSLDEHAKSAIEDMVSSMLMGGQTTEAEYVRQVGKVVRTIERGGAAVVVGRGAQFVVDPASALRVRVVCAEEQRIAGYAERQGLDAAEAARKVRTTERDRQRFVTRYYERDVAAPSAYDLVLNTGTMPVPTAAEIILAAYEARFGERPRSG